MNDPEQQLLQLLLGRHALDQVVNPAVRELATISLPDWFRDNHSTIGGFRYSVWLHMLWESCKEPKPKLSNPTIVTIDMPHESYPYTFLPPTGMPEECPSDSTHLFYPSVTEGLISRGLHLPQCNIFFDDKEHMLSFSMPVKSENATLFRYISLQTLSKEFPLHETDYQVMLQRRQRLSFPPSDDHAIVIAVQNTSGGDPLRLLSICFTGESSDLTNKHPFYSLAIRAETDMLELLKNPPPH